MQHFCLRRGPLRLKSLRRAQQALACIMDFRPAVVAYADKVPASLLEEESEDADDKFTGTDKAAFLELQHASCLSVQPVLTGVVFPSKVLVVAGPTMKNHPYPTKLSEVSSVIELLLSYSDVDFAAD